MWRRWQTCSGGAKTVVHGNTIWSPTGNITECGMQLGEGVQFYAKEGKPYCKKDFLANFCPPCGGCGEPIAPEEMASSVALGGKRYHAGHLTCTACGRAFEAGETICQKDGNAYCKKDYMELIAERCSGCNLPLQGSYLNALGKKWHKHCLVCFACGKPFQVRVR